MSGRLLPNGILCDHGLPMPKRMAMDGAPLPAPAPVEVTVDTREELSDLERQQLAKLIPNLYRL